jgi:death-on-curing protein
VNWIKAEYAIGIHKQLVHDFGGPQGVRDAGLLESALARPLNLQAYEGIEDPVRLAASYGYGICRNHPFVDGNKRTSLMVMYIFLLRNGFRLVAPEPDALVTIQELAQGVIGEPELAQWLADNCVAIQAQE